MCARLVDLAGSFGSKFPSGLWVEGLARMEVRMVTQLGNVFRVEIRNPSGKTIGQICQVTFFNVSDTFPEQTKVRNHS